jgi:hypothetical protein
VRDPARNVGRSTFYGSLASGVVYLLSLVAVFGILPASALALDKNQASYSAAADAIVGSGSWAGDLVARGGLGSHGRRRRRQRDRDPRGSGRSRTTGPGRELISGVGRGVLSWGQTRNR